MFLSQLPPDVIQPVLEALPMPVFFKDRAGIYRGCNQAFTTLLGLSPADVAGLHKAPAVRFETPAVAAILSMLVTSKPLARNSAIAAATMASRLRSVRR